MINIYILLLKKNRKRFKGIGWFLLLILSTILCVLIFEKSYILNNEEKYYDGTYLLKFKDKVYDSVPHYKAVIMFDSLEMARIIDIDSIGMLSNNDRVTVPLKRSYTDKGNWIEFSMMISLSVLIISIVFIFKYIFFYIGHLYSDYRWVSLKTMKERKIIDPLGEEDWYDDNI